MVAILYALAALLWQAPPAQQPPTDVHVQLSLRDGKTRFRTGEPIRLVLTFKADTSGHLVDTTTTIPASPIDDIEISPDAGVFHWLDLYSSGGRYSPDYSVLTDPSLATVDVVLPLNWWMRFDQRGDYTVRVRTRRVHEARQISPPDVRAAIPLTTNDVTFHVDPMSDDEEAAEVSRLSGLLDATPPRNLELQTERCEDLAFLPGDAAAREKVRLYFRPEGHIGGNWTRDLSMGFFISRHPAIILSVFEEALNDLSRPARAEWIWQAAAIHGWLNQLGGAPGPERQIPMSVDPIRDEYVNRLIASLSAREGRSRLDTAETILMVAGGRRQPIVEVVRRIIIDGFDSLPTSTQGELVSERWKDIRDPVLAPALRRLLTAPGYLPRAAILNALADLDPAGGRARIIADIVNPTATTSMSVLKSLPDATLPEVEGPLLAQVQRLAVSRTPRESALFSDKTALLARYASGAIRADVETLLQTSSAALPTTPKANLLAYLVKWDEAAALSEIQHEIDSGQDVGSLLNQMTVFTWSPGLAAMVRRRLDDDNPQTVVESAGELRAHRAAADRPALQARLDRWLTVWGRRGAELERDTTWNSQGAVQGALIQALLAWTLTDAESQSLRNSCVTSQCRAMVGVK